jgi:GntR family transcriptional regulator
MEIDLDPNDPTPLYLQIAARVRRLVALGALVPGDRIPTVRDLAVRARVNRNTAARAIQELEREGLVRTRVGQGTFVADGGGKIDVHAREGAIDGRIDRLVEDAVRLRVPLEELPERVQRRIESFRSNGPEDGRATHE